MSEGPRCKRCHDPVEAGFFILGCCVECSYLEQAALDERAAIVAWLNDPIRNEPTYPSDLAYAIERNEHLEENSE